MIDIVYPLGNQTCWDNNELRFSLRSVGMYLKNVRNVYIIGNRVSFLDGVVTFPFKEQWGKDRNIMAKIAFASALPNISDEFLVVHDDHFMLEEMDATTFPYYCSGDLSGLMSSVASSNSYKKVLTNTYNALHQNGFPTQHFDVHAPMRFSKHDFINVMNEFDWSIKHGFAVKSLYANYTGRQGEEVADLKLHERRMRFQILEAIKGRKFFSMGDRSLNGDLKMVMKELFPEKSRFEK